METILILHGWGGGAKSWDEVKEILENNGYNVLVPDLPGFGKNPPPAQPWTVDDYFRWLEDFCKENNLSQFCLLGHSFGGGLAVKFTNRFPEKVKKLILVAPKIRRQKNYRYYLGLVMARVGKIIFSAPLFHFLQPLARRVLYSLLGVHDYYKLDMQKSFIMKETFKKVVGEDLTGYLVSIKNPTLIIWGKSDNMTPLKDAFLINKTIEGSKLELIDKGEHVLNFQFPDILAQKVINFIKS